LSDEAAGRKRKLEIKYWKIENGNWKLEIGNRKQAVYSNYVAPSFSF
jgi:hypothetical protein